MTNPNWASLLERARAGEAKTAFTPYMEELVKPATLDSDVRLRVLGNAVAHNDENRNILLESGLVPQLIAADDLRLSVLYNFVLDNERGAEYLMSYLSKLRPVLSYDREMAFQVLTAIASHQQLPPHFVIELINDGYIPVVLADPRLEWHPEVIERLDYILAAAYKLESSGRAEIAVKVLGNISSHKFFDKDHLLRLKLVEHRDSLLPLLLLSNVSSSAEAIPFVSENWPHALDDAVGILQDINAEYENPELSDGENSDPEEPTQTSSDPHGAESESESESESEADGETLDEEDELDLIAGYYLRNLSRDPDLAIKIWTAGETDVIKPLLRSARYREAGIQLAGNLALQVMSTDLLDSLLKVKVSGETASSLITAYSKALEGLSVMGTDGAVETSEYASKLAAGLRDMLDMVPGIFQTEALWIKGSKGLALAANLGASIRDIDGLLSGAPDNDNVRANLAAVKRD